MPLIRSALLSLLLIAPAYAQDATKDAPPFDPRKVDVAKLIRCEAQPEDFLPVAIAIQDPLNAVSLGWRPLPKSNMFLSEFALNTPITVFGHETSRIAFAGSSVMAVLDLPDPRPLAKQLALETGIDTPEKAMFGKELVSDEFTDPATGKAMVRSVILNVSNVASHPGQTLAGCTYSIDPLEEEPPAAPAEAPAPPAPKG